jgi:hypothetical protein
MRVHPPHSPDIDRIITYTQYGRSVGSCGVIVGLSFICLLRLRVSVHYPQLISVSSRSYLFPLSISVYLSYQTSHSAGLKSTMSLFTDLQAPNGRKYEQPTGLFINNEFVASSSGQTITSIDPA